MDVRVTPINPRLTIHKSCNDECFPPCRKWKIPYSEVLVACEQAPGEDGKKIGERGIEEFGERSDRGAS